MQSEYRVKRIYTEEDGGVVAKCYDILYGEDFEKYLGYPDDFDGKENASNLLQDSTYEMSDELRAEIEELFNVEEFNDEQDYDGYQFFDFDDDFDDEDDDEDEMNQRALAMMGKRESFNLREALNQIDIDTYNKYDLLNLYESCDLKENEKRALANIVYDQEDPRVIYDTLNNRYVSGEEIGMPERVKDGVIHESTDSTLKTCLNAWNKLVKESPSYDGAIDLVTTAEQLVGYYIDRYEEEAYSTYLDNRGILSNVTPEMDKEIIKLFNQITEIEWTGEYLEESVEDDLGDDELNAFYKGYTEEDEDENSAYNKLKKNTNSIKEEAKVTRKYNGKSLTEGFYRGCKGVTMIGHGEWSDPELEYDGYLFNYWDIEDALWHDFLDETGWTDVDGDEPVVENEFNEYVKARCVDYLNDCIYGGAFTGLSIEGDIVDFPNGEYYYVGYEDGKISLDNAYNTGRAPEYSIDYDFDESIDTNLQRLYDYAIEKSPWLNGDDDLDESKSIRESKEIVKNILSKQLKDNRVKPFKDDKERPRGFAFKSSNGSSGQVRYNGKDYVFAIVDGELRVMTDAEAGSNWSETIYKKIEESSYKKGDRVELDNGMTGTVTKDFDWENEDQVAVEIDDTGEMRYPRSETLKDLRESDEETPYTKEEIERDLKSITHNFTDKDGELKCGFEEEKNFAVEILKQHYKVVETSGDDRRDGTWYHISFAEPIEK